MSLLPIHRDPTRRQLRVFTAAWLIVAGAAGGRLGMHHHQPLGIALVAAAIAVPAAGLFQPEVLRRTYVGLSMVTYPIGWALSWVVLTGVYYAVLTPIALVMRVLKYDPLRRKFDRSAPTYWTGRPPPPAPESYFRQN